MDLRAKRRDRAFRTGPELFLHDRAFDDCIERIRLVQRSFRSALLIGCPNPDWLTELGARVGQVQVIEPGPAFAEAAAGECAVEDRWMPPIASFDLCLAVGTLDTVNDLPRALNVIRASMAPDALLIGAMAGGETLPALRSAMIAADQVTGAASPHVHPRIEAAALAQLLSASGFSMPVVDIDRVRISYQSLGRLVADLRAMAATNILRSRSKTSLSRNARAAAERGFMAAGDGERTVEQIELLHFAAWTPSAPR